VILAVVGSTALKDGLQAKTATSLIKAVLTRFNPDKVISGGAVGIDSLAEDVAADLGFPFEKFLPKNKRWEPEGYKDRNMKIAESCDLLLCIRTAQSKTYGSGWTADYAESLGKPVGRKII